MHSTATAVPKSIRHLMLQRSRNSSIPCLEARSSHNAQPAAPCCANSLCSEWHFFSPPSILCPCCWAWRVSCIVVAGSQHELHQPYSDFECENQSDGKGSQGHLLCPRETALVVCVVQTAALTSLCKFLPARRSDLPQHCTSRLSLGVYRQFQVRMQNCPVIPTA